LREVPFRLAVPFSVAEILKTTGCPLMVIELPDTVPFHELLPEAIITSFSEVLEAEIDKVNCTPGEQESFPL